MQYAFDFGQPGALNRLTVTYVNRKTNKALEFGRSGVQNIINVPQLCRHLHSGFGFGQVLMPDKENETIKPQLFLGLIILAGGWAAARGKPK